MAERRSVILKWVFGSGEEFSGFVDPVIIFARVRVALIRGVGLI